MKHSDWIPDSFDRPEVITLIGSSRFKEAFNKANKVLTLQGKIVISLGLFGHLDGLDMDGPVKKMLDELHLRKIDLADAVYVVNCLALICCACRKLCTFTFHAVGATGYSNSKCCKAEVSMKPYIGESTKRELEYARSNHKTIYSLNPLT